MRPHPHSPDDNESRQFALITHRYLRYILIRSLAYTNRRTLAQQIGVYTLITTCLLAGRLRRRADLGIVVDTMVETVGHDQAISGKGRVIRDERKTEAATLNTVDARICDVAGGINSVGQLGRQLLVLRHIEGIDAPALAELHQMPVTRIETVLAEAEREFVGILRGMAWDHEIGPDVHGILNDLAACLDQRWAREVAVCALDYLARHRRRQAD